VREWRIPAAVNCEARIAALLDDGARTFGNLIGNRYAALILRAMQDVADQPLRPGARSDKAIDPHALFYHLRNSRTRLPPARRVGNPRHILAYEIGEDGIVGILGLIPDMIPSDIAVPRYIPDRFEDGI
jgi:hypothetical protein